MITVPFVAFALTLAAKQFWVFRYPMPQDQLAHYVRFWIIQSGPILYFCFQFWVVATVLHPRSWTTRFLELPPLRFLGRLSYSIYLWHALFFLAARPAVGVHAPWLLLLASRPWRYVATLGMSLLSYYTIERPMIRLGHRLAKPSTPGHRDLGPPSPALTEARS